MKLKENKGMSLIVFTIILAVLVVVAGGVIVYLLNNPVKEKVAIQTPSTIQSNMSNNENNVVKENVSANINDNETKVEQVKEMTAEEKYSIWVQNVEREVSKASENAFYQDIELSNGKIINVGLTSKGVLYLTREDQGSREFDTNVINFEICDVGNGGYKAAYYIKKDGTVSFVVLDEYEKNDGEVKPILVKDAKNIVSIINNTYTDEPSYAAEVWLIDIEGKVYKNN